jgi:DNA-binding response OmpR family regulator
MNTYKILFVDDDDFIRKIYGDRFAASGIDATLADSVQKAEEILREQNFDLVCVDYLFPTETGLDLVKWIRDDKNLKTPIVIFTASGQEADKEQFEKFGMIEYVKKDQVNPSDLVALIKSSIDKSKKND